MLPHFKKAHSAKRQGACIIAAQAKKQTSRLVKQNKPFASIKQAVWLKRYGSMPPTLRRNGKNPRCNAKERQQAASSSTRIYKEKTIKILNKK
jgi:hypothetical protein